VAGVETCKSGRRADDGLPSPVGKRRKEMPEKVVLYFLKSHAEDCMADNPG
jgi:hypothetical protein